MACIITHDNKKYTQPEFNEYFKSHFFEFASDFLGSKQDIEGFKKFVEQPINKEIKPKIDSSKKIKNKIPKTGDVIEYNAVQYKVEETSNNYYSTPDDFDDSLESYVKTQLEENMPYYNLNPTNWRDVTVGNIDPLFNVPLIALVKDGFTFVTQEQPIVETKEELPGLDNLPDPQCK